MQQISETFAEAHHGSFRGGEMVRRGVLDESSLNIEGGRYRPVHLWRRDLPTQVFMIAYEHTCAAQCFRATLHN